MATIGSDPNGRKRILFLATGGVRKTVRLGKASMRQAEAFKVKVEQLASAAILGHSPDDETARWLAELDPRMHARLVAAGLARTRATAAVGTLDTLLVEFFANITVKAGTRTTYEQTRRTLLEHFGETRDVRTIGRLDADKWRQWLKGQALADATISKRVKTARQIFAQGIEWEMLAKNPFAKMKAGSQENKSRQRFISRTDAGKVLDACPDAEWRLIFALSRYGGLRCPSEHLALKWADVDWDKSRLRVTSPKTEGYEGGDHRDIPIFPELLPFLREAFEQAEEGATYAVARYREASCNLRTQMNRILRRAGLTPWPRLFHNLRSTRQTELAESFPIQTVCAWLGNSEKIARRHYLQVTDAHFERAAQIPAQQAPAGTGTERQTVAAESQKAPVLPELSTICRSVPNQQVTPTGFEPVSRP